MRSLIPFAVLMLLFSFNVYAAGTDNDNSNAETLSTQPVDPEVTESCTIEGQSMSYKDKALEAYIAECIADFTETDLVITPS